MVGLISMMPTSWTMKNKSHKIEHDKYDTSKLKRLIPKQFIKRWKANLFPWLNEETANRDLHLHLFTIP